MQVCTTKSVFDAILRRGELDPATANPSAAEKANIAELICERFKEAYEDSFWPEIMLVERRYYRSTWDTDLTYITGEEIWYSDAYYRSLQDANIGHNPATEPTWWEEIVDGDTLFIRYIDFEQDGETPIGAVDCNDCIFDRDPQLYRDAGRIGNVIILGERILVRAEEAPERPYVKFRPVTPKFSLTDWNAATNYGIGELCYYATTGETYKALRANTNANPYTETQDWEPVYFPDFLRNYVVNAVAADRLTEDEGRFKAYNKVDEILEKLHERIIEQRQGPMRATFTPGR